MLLFDNATELSIALNLLSVFKTDLNSIATNLFDNFTSNEYVSRTVNSVKFSTHFLITLTVITAPCRSNRLFDNRHHYLFW
ncbi:hypothetical protein D3C79_1072170 [compost metagenome]